MNKEQQRLEIAKACGWKLVDVYQWDENNPSVRLPMQFHIDLHGEPWGIPDYLNDLNAMHEAVQRFRYTDTGSTLWASNQGHLMTVIARDLSIARDCVSFMWEVQNATAAQRAEAFLRALNLWKEDAPTP